MRIEKGLRDHPPSPINHLQRRQLFVRVLCRIHLRVRLGDHAVFVDDVGDAFRVFVLRAFGGAVGEADLLLRVAEEGEVEVVFGGEGGVFLLVVEAGAEDLGVPGVVLVAEVPEPGTFPRSAGGAGLGVEPEHHLLPAQVGKADAIAFVIGDVEIRGFVAGLEHGAVSSKSALPEHPDDTAEGHDAIVGAWRRSRNGMKGIARARS